MGKGKKGKSDRPLPQAPAGGGAAPQQFDMVSGFVVAGTREHGTNVLSNRCFTRNWPMDRPRVRYVVATGPRGCSSGGEPAFRFISMAPGACGVWTRYLAVRLYIVDGEGLAISLVAAAGSEGAGAVCLNTRVRRRVGESPCSIWRCGQCVWHSRLPV